MTGIDFSEAAIEVARNLANREGFSHINFLVHYYILSSFKFCFTKAVFHSTQHNQNSHNYFIGGIKEYQNFIHTIDFGQFCLIPQPRSDCFIQWLWYKTKLFEIDGICLILSFFCYEQKIGRIYARIETAFHGNSTAFSCMGNCR